MENQDNEKKRRKPPDKHRKIKKLIKFSEDEMTKALTNMGRLNIKNFSQFVRLKTTAEGTVLFKDRVSGKGGMRESEFLLATAINKVGVNVNQIAKAVNENKVSGKPVVMEEIKQQLEAFLEELKYINNLYLNFKGDNNSEG